MLKTHTAGVGDLLRGSAAWRALRNAFPQARLHLWFFTTRPGAPSEELIANHHLIYSFKASVKGAGGLKGLWRLLQDANEIAERTRPDLIVDFEPHGIRTSLLAWWVGRRTKALTVGIDQVLHRGMFYGRAAPGMKCYAKQRNLPFPLEYTERDFVALAALGIERKGTPIELHETGLAKAFRSRLTSEIGTARSLLGLNIGSGLEGSTHRRPNLELLAGLVCELQRRHGFDLVLTGAPYENEVNQEFMRRFPMEGKVTNLAGKTTIRELVGAIAACRLFISGDSGPYHIGVALRVPTLAIFNFPNPVHYHTHSWVECLVAPDAASLPVAIGAAERLLVAPRDLSVTESAGRKSE